MAENDVIVERLEHLRNELVFLKQERDRLGSLADYVADPRSRRAIERSLQLACEASLDIGRRLIRNEGWRFPEDNRDVFQVLSEAGVVSEEQRSDLARMASFRNLIVHDYAGVDDAQVHRIFTRHLGTFDAFAAVVERYMDRRGASASAPDASS